MKTLVVQETRGDGRRLEALLAVCGPCVVVPDGDAAIRESRKALQEGEPYDFLCLDLLQPGANWREVVAGLRREEERYPLLQANARVLVTTVLRDDHRTVDCLRKQCDACLIKPVEPRALFACVARLGLLEEAWRH
ncbi:MAG: hypothetical protein JW958_01060 [Candidatus Eisenbacteria bacterium]|nr:hypothetical protein [Candidatus Eisenbacteria bacterium]